MRAEGALLGSNSERHKGLFDLGCKLCQGGVSFYADPKHACGLLVGKEPSATERDLEYLHGNRTQCILHFAQIRLWLLADEFQRYVQRLRADPSHIRRKAAH